MQTHLLYKQPSLLGPDGFSLWTGGGMAFFLGRRGDLVLEKRRAEFLIMSCLLLLAGFGSLILQGCAAADLPHPSLVPASSSCCM